MPSENPEFDSVPELPPEAEERLLCSLEIQKAAQNKVKQMVDQMSGREIPKREVIEDLEKQDTHVFTQEEIENVRTLGFPPSVWKKGKDGNQQTDK